MCDGHRHAFRKRVLYCCSYSCSGLFGDFTACKREKKKKTVCCSEFVVVVLESISSYPDTKKYHILFSAVEIQEWLKQVADPDSPSSSTNQILKFLSGKMADTLRNSNDSPTNLFEVIFPKDLHIVLILSALIQWLQLFLSIIYI